MCSSLLVGLSIFVIAHEIQPPEHTWCKLMLVESGYLCSDNEGNIAKTGKIQYVEDWDRGRFVYNDKYWFDYSEFQNDVIKEECNDINVTDPLVHPLSFFTSGRIIKYLCIEGNKW